MSDAENEPDADPLFEDHEDDPGPDPVPRAEFEREARNPHAKSRTLAKKAGRGAYVGVGAPIPLIANEDDFNLANVMKVGVTIFANRSVRLSFMQSEAALIADELLVETDAKKRRSLQKSLLDFYKEIGKLESQLGETAEQIVVIRKGRGHEIGAAGEMRKVESEVLPAGVARMIDVPFKDAKTPRSPRPADRGAKHEYRFRPSSQIHTQFRDQTGTGTGG